MSEIGCTYHSSDYARMARTLQRMRSVKGNRYQGKDQEHQVKIDALADIVAGVFATDSLLDPEGIQFSKSAFLAGTQLTEVPEFSTVASNAPEDDDPADWPADAFA